VVFVFFLSSTHSCAPSAYTLAYPTVLTIVHLDGTSILSLYNISTELTKAYVLDCLNRTIAIIKGWGEGVSFAS
jgi:hypothetical protein